MQIQNKLHVHFTREKIELLKQYPLINTLIKNFFIWQKLINCITSTINQMKKRKIGKITTGSLTLFVESIIKISKMS